MDSLHSATDQSESSAGELVLRIRGTDQDGQLFRLRARKCTIGTGEKCTLRLSDKNIAPLHCLILRGQGGTVARRWAPKTLLNGQPFSDAELAPGDTLGIGPLEFEVVALNEGGDYTAMRSSDEFSTRTIPFQDDSLIKETREPSDLIESLNAAKAVWDLRNNQINQEVAALENEKQLLTREKTAFSEERNAFAEERKVFDADRAALLTDRSALQAERETQRIEKESLFSERNCLEVERQQFKSLHSERERFQKEVDDFQKERDSRELELQRWAAELAAATQAAADAEKVGKQLECLEAEGKPEKTDDPKAEVDLQEILRRLGHNVEFPDDEPPASNEDFKRMPGACASSECETPSLATSEPPAEDEESIDNYMAQLMQRLGAKTPGTGVAPPRTGEQAASSRPAASEAASEPSPQAPSPREGVWQRREPVELAPRAVAPEKSVDLSALRDLANLSAKQALGKHEHQQLKMAKRSKLIVIGVSLAVGAGLLWHWRAHNGGTLLAISALLSFLIAAYWGLQYAILTGRLIIDRSGGIALPKTRGKRRPPVLQGEKSAENIEECRSAEKPGDPPEMK
jgi:hypothetical protein